MNKKDFMSSLSALAESLRRNIEANCDGFNDRPDEIAARRARVFDAVTGFGFFVETYFPHYIRSPHQSELHQYLFRRLPEIIRSDESCLDATAAPRGEAKSTIVTQLFTLYCLITRQKRFAVVVMDSIDQAYPMLEAIKAELEFNPRLKTDFPEACGQGRVWQAGSIVTALDQKIVVAGSGKKLRGLRHGAYRPDLVVLDDIENDEQVRSPEQRDKLHNWLKKTVLPLGAAGEKMDIVYIGTVLHYDSVLSRTLNNPAWTTARFKALITPPENMDLWDRWEELFINDGEPVAAAFYATHKAEMDKGAVVSWAARPLIELMKIRARDGHSTFDSEYQNDPVSTESSTFANVLDSCFYKALPPNLTYFGALDPSLGRAGASRDPSAILIGGYDRVKGVLYVIEAQIKKRLPDLIIEDVIRLQKQYHCVLWAVETVQFQEFLKTELTKRGAQRGVPIPARAVKPSTDKLLRIESLHPYFVNGQIRLAPTQSTLIEQLRHFPMAAHDDGPDALQMLWMIASTYSSGGAVPLTLPEPIWG